MDKSLAGQKAKFSLIFKGNFDVISFDNYFLVRNKKNLNEIEYTWGGVVPNEGKQLIYGSQKLKQIGPFIRLEKLNLLIISKIQFYIVL